MALQAIVHHDGYSYTEAVETMDSKTIQKSKSIFELYKLRGIIVAGEYEGRQWVLTDEVKKGVAISFQIDEVHFARETTNKLACSLADYEQAMRLLITSRFGYSLRTLQSDAAVLRNFADSLAVPTDYAQAQVLSDLLTLLPGYTQFREDVQCMIDDISPLLQSNRQQRRLAHYQTYLRFSELFSDFWATAVPAEKILYFPVWFWFYITSVLPLRPTECVLTPRQCITHKAGRYYLEVRRSKKKGTTQDLRYCMEKDYERCQYPIPDHLAVQIMEYLSATENTYRSDIDVLFCKEAQFAEADVLIESDNHYTYSNLRQCLSYFYRKVIEGQYGYIVVSGHDRLGDGEIGRIQLGDMRHIAMVALAVCGGSPSVCKELAGHDSIEISAHYYSNLTTFLDLLGYERYREIQTSTSNAYGLMASRQYPVANGYCQCEQVWRKDYAPCESAVDADGVPGSCNNCRWYLPAKQGVAARGEKTQKDKAADALQQTCLLLRQAVERVREGLGCVDTISSILDKLAAQSRQYIHLSAVERIIESEE